MSRPFLSMIDESGSLTMSSRSIQLSLVYLPSKENQAHASSRRLSLLDFKLLAAAFEAVDRAFGAKQGTLLI